MEVGDDLRGSWYTLTPGGITNFYWCLLFNVLDEHHYGSERERVHYIQLSCRAVRVDLVPAVIVSTC